MLVFSFGSAEKGQLGNGTTGERITTGNKTSYDIESAPGVLFASFLTMFYDLTFHRHPSLYQGARWEEHRSNCVRTTAQSGTGFDRVSPISLFPLTLTSTFVAVSYMSGDTMVTAASDWAIKSTL